MLGSSARESELCMASIVMGMCAVLCVACYLAMCVRPYVLDVFRVAYVCVLCLASSSEFPIWLDVNRYERDGRTYFSGIITRVRDDDNTSGEADAVQLKIQHLGDYLLCDSLGKGSTAKVRLGRHSSTGMPVRAVCAVRCCVLCAALRCYKIDVLLSVLTFFASVSHLTLSFLLTYSH